MLTATPLPIAKIWKQPKCDERIKKMWLIYSHLKVAQTVKNLPAMQETQVQPLGREDHLENGMAAHSSILAWRIPIQWNTAAAKLLQSCPTLCDPIDGSPLGSSVPGILQARILECVAISFSTMKYYSAIKQDWNFAICTTQMDLEHIMLSGISQIEKDKYCMISLVCTI